MDISEVINSFKYYNVWELQYQQKYKEYFDNIKSGLSADFVMQFEDHLWYHDWTLRSINFVNPMKDAILPDVIISLVYGNEKADIVFRKVSNFSVFGFDCEKNYPGYCDDLLIMCFRKASKQKFSMHCLFSSGMQMKIHFKGVEIHSD